jgi:hypothetical protein
MPHPAFGGRTPDEMFFGTGAKVPEELALAKSNAHGRGEERREGGGELLHTSATSYVSRTLQFRSAHGLRLPWSRLTWAPSILCTVGMRCTRL